MPQVKMVEGHQLINEFCCRLQMKQVGRHCTASSKPQSLLGAGLVVTTINHRQMT